METAQCIRGRTDCVLKLNKNPISNVFFWLNKRFLFSAVFLSNWFLFAFMEKILVYMTYISATGTQIPKCLVTSSPAQTSNLLGKKLMKIKMANYSHWTFLSRKQYYCGLFFATPANILEYSFYNEFKWDSFPDPHYHTWWQFIMSYRSQKIGEILRKQ